MWHHRAVRVRVLTLAVFAGAGLVEVLGVWLGSPPVYLRGAVVALVALTGYVLLAGAGHPLRVRLPVLAIAAVPAANAVIDLIRYAPPEPAAFLTPGFVSVAHPPNPYVEALQPLPGNLAKALPMLTVLVATFDAVIALPVRYRRRVAAAAGMLAVACTVPNIQPLYEQGQWGYYGWDAQPWVPVVAGIAFAAVPVLVLALAGVTATVGSRRAPLAALGLAVLVIPALLTVGAAQLAGIAPTATQPSAPPDTDVVYAIAVAQVPASTTHPQAALLHACYLTALLLLAAGCLAARRADRA